jgi:tRNA (adenine37-N6)-methyltransferase
MCNAMNINISPIGFVKNKRENPIDDQWSSVVSTIELLPHIPQESLLHIDQFSHLEIVYYFHQADLHQIKFTAHPRGNPFYPSVGIYAQRKKERPNAIGLSTVELIQLKGRTIRVKNLDAIDGTPVIDIKPVYKAFLPVGKIKQPEWVADLMKHYW